MRASQWFFRDGRSRDLLGSLLVAINLLAANAAAANYTVVDLATLSQGSPSVVRGPNSAGVAVGRGTLVGASAVVQAAPSSATAGGPAFTLTVNGSNFVAGAAVR